MSGYFGTEEQQRLQQLAETSAAEIAGTPGACQIGRIMGCDDPDRLGWDKIDQILDRDEVFAFRLIPLEKIDGIRARLAARNFRLDVWDLFIGERARALPLSEAIVANGLPPGMVDLDEPVDPEGEHTRSIQGLISRSGIVPFSGSFLTGGFGPSTTVSVGDENGNTVSVAHGYLPHNRHSPWHSHGWGGLVAVDQVARGKGLGNHVNAMMIVRVFRKLGASHIYELVSASNEASRRMVRSCGLEHVPSLTCGIAIAEDRERFTR